MRNSPQPSPTQPSDRSLARRLNFGMLGLARHWQRVLLVVLGIFVTLPWVAPTLMAAGLEGPGRALYTLYAPFCHQFPFRSFFLFGDQPVYPRANVPSGWQPYEVYEAREETFAPFTPADAFTSLEWTFAQKGFAGNAEMGFKTTLCERDLAIYTGLFAFTLVYGHPVVRRRLRPAPIWLFILLGLGPIGIDGFSQLLGYPPFEFWPARETLPEFRVLTGTIFGLMIGWLALPYIEEGMQETQAELEGKLRKAGLLPGT